MRHFNLIHEGINHVRLVEIYCVSGVYREFTGRTYMQDAIRYLNRVCSDDSTRTLTFIDHRKSEPDHC